MNNSKLKIENGQLKMNENILVDKSFDFAIRVVKLYKYLCDEKKEYVLSKVANSGYEVNFPQKQLLRFGTSIGANINETYVQSLSKEISEIAKLLTSIVKSSQEN